MSKLGRKKKNAYLGRKKAFREWIEALVLLALVLFFCVGNCMEAYPAAEDLKEYTGFYQRLQSGKVGRRSKAYRIVLEDGNGFYVHPNFNKKEFLDAVSPGDELHILAADIRQPLDIRGDLENVVFELYTSDGLKLRDYDATVIYLQEMQKVRIMTWGFFSLIFAVVAVLSFRDWRKYKAKCAEIKARKAQT